MNNDFIISDDIYNESLSLKEGYHHITDDIYFEAKSLTDEDIRKQLTDSFGFSDRFWVWKSYNFIKDKEIWGMMLKQSEIWFDVNGLKYFNSYPTVQVMENAYLLKNPSSTRSIPSACFAFANYLRKGDVVMAYNSNNFIVAWCVIEGNYMFRPTRKNGKQYRKATWSIINMPGIFSFQPSSLYQISKSESRNLKETLINKLLKSNMTIHSMNLY